MYVCVCVCVSVCVCVCVYVYIYVPSSPQEWTRRAVDWQTSEAHTAPLFRSPALRRVGLALVV